MKAWEILRRIKGISTPLGGLDWEAPLPQRTVAKKVLVYLEDRRVLTDRGTVPASAGDADRCVASVFQIRETLTEVLLDADTGDELAEPLRAMRSACRRFLDGVGAEGSPAYGRGRIQYAAFGTALGELRAVFGMQLGVIAVRYKLDLPDDLAALLPAAD